MKLWGGRFTKETDALVNAFNASITFDQRLYRQDILGSQAHAKMLAKQGIITTEEGELICKTLSEILADLEKGNLNFDINYEDIHMNIEKMLIDRIGQVGKKVHTGRSRNDQVALDLRLYCKEEISEFTSLLDALLETLMDIAKDHLHTIMPGYTHLQKAQPVTLAHHIMAYVAMFHRDKERLEDCYKRTDVMPLGSGALASTSYPLDRYFVAKELGFTEISMNSMDAVSDRDYALELVHDLSLIMMHLSRFCEELILWSSDQMQFIQLDDAYSTGSSIMPQKKNPDIPELIRGKTGRVYGSLMGLLTVLKGLPLAYNKDMQEDKEQLFDALDTTKGCLILFSAMMATTTFNKDKMLEATKGGFMTATDVADYLVKKGLPFRDAHEVVGKLVLSCLEQDLRIEELSLADFKKLHPLFDETIYDFITLEACVASRNLPGGPAAKAILEAIEYYEKKVPCS